MKAMKKAMKKTMKQVRSWRMTTTTRHRPLPRPITVFLLLSILAAAGGGCRSFSEVDEVAHVFTIAVDKSTINKVKVGIRVPIARLVGKVQGQAIGGGGGEQELYLITSTDAPSILSGINAMQTYIERQISLEHARLLLISEEFAREGLEEEITPILRFPETRSNMYVAISKGDPIRLLMENRPFLDVNIAKYVELVHRMADLTGYSELPTVNRFYNHMRSPGREAVAAILAVNEEVLAQQEKEEQKKAGGLITLDLEGEEEEKADEGEKGQPDKAPEPPARTPGSTSAGKIPREGGSVVEWLGLAVFKGDRMVGELNGNESLAYRLLTGTLAEGVLTVAEPQNPKRLITVNLKPGRPPAIKTFFQDQIAVVQVDLLLEVNVDSITSGDDLEQSEAVHRIEEAVKLSLEAWLAAVVRKTQDWGTDIFGFGEHFRRHYASWQDWDNAGWSDKFKTADIRINLRVMMRRPGLLIQTESSSVK
ncbi:MAG TPA: Ger(x)C family spore germination protein [Firmicutes bacterium]|nr:Ger(x)C family spore germination protein [Bacillota bacterium]